MDQDVSTRRSMGGGPSIEVEYKEQSYYEKTTQTNSDGSNYENEKQADSSSWKVGGSLGGSWSSSSDSDNSPSLGSGNVPAIKY